MKYYYNVIVNQLLLNDDYQADYTNALTLYSRALDVQGKFYYKKIPCIVSYDKDTKETYCYLNGTRVPVLIYDDTKESYPEYINKVIDLMPNIESTKFIYTVNKSSLNSKNYASLKDIDSKITLINSEYPYDILNLTIAKYAREGQKLNKKRSR